VLTYADVNRSPELNFGEVAGVSLMSYEMSNDMWPGLKVSAERALGDEVTMCEI